MNSPFEIGRRLYKQGKGISDLAGAVKQDSDLEEAHNGYVAAMNESNIVDEQNNEVMDILQEECAEVIQAVSKIRRFGIEGKHPNHDYNNREHLEEELGDVLAMIDILLINKIVDWGNLHRAKRAKIEKLKKWSNIPNLDKI